MTKVKRTALSLLIATTAFTAAIGSPAFARVSEHALAARAQASYPNGNSPEYAPARINRNAAGRSMGYDPSGYVRIEESKDCHGC
jgi:hypothetical protein